MRAMTFPSVLFRPGDSRALSNELPGCFADLNLDQVVEAITAERDNYHLQSFFYTSLYESDAIVFRQEIFHDLENGSLIDGIRSFATQMQEVRKQFALLSKYYHKRQREGLFLDVMEIFFQALLSLANAFASGDIRSRGLITFRDYLDSYLASPGFQQLSTETQRLRGDLAKVRYCLVIKGLTARVMPFHDESDYSAEVERTFAKFKQGTVKDYRCKFPEFTELNSVEADLLDFVAELNPSVFSGLSSFCVEHGGTFLEPGIVAFDREIQFYLSYFDFIAPLQAAGLAFAYPFVSESKEINALETFDIALAAKLVPENAPVVSNDFSLAGPERIFVVSGPNQGGKTTFARTFGQLHYLASLGCPVAGREANLCLSDAVLTHFEREENIENQRGKLQDDLVRIHDILRQATPNSILIMNEIFTSTTLEDAIFLSEKVLQQIVKLDALCVCVSFLDELGCLGKQLVSMLSLVDPDDPARRTFKVQRRRADGRAYAMTIAEKYQLSRECLRQRIRL
jgi:DNA mismatch repair protein MutS